MAESGYDRNVARLCQAACGGLVTKKTQGFSLWANESNPRILTGSCKFSGFAEKTVPWVDRVASALLCYVDQLCLLKVGCYALKL